MERYIERLPEFVSVIRDLREIIITNITLIGQIPSPTFKEKKRAAAFLERLAGFQVDECTTDGYRNPIGIIQFFGLVRIPTETIAHPNMATQCKETTK